MTKLMTLKQQIAATNTLLGKARMNMEHAASASFKEVFLTVLSQKKQLAVLRAEMILQQIERGSEYMTQEIETLQEQLESCFAAIRATTRDAIHRNLWSPAI